MDWTDLIWPGLLGFVFGFVCGIATLSKAARERRNHYR